MPHQQRQQRMRGRASDDLQFTLLLKFSKRPGHIAPVRQPSVPRFGEPMMIHPRERLIRAVPMGAMNLLLREFNQPFKMPLIAFLQERVEQHRA